MDYISLNQSDPEEPGEAKFNPSWPLRARNAVISLLALYGLFSLIILCYTTLDLKASPDPCFCGKTPAEAIQNGCKFDPFALTWVPDACRDDELIDEFNALGALYNHSWQFYTWPTHDRLVTLDEVSMMAEVASTKHDNHSTVTTTVDWHHTHCLYLWRKLYRSRYTKRAMEKRYDTEHHQKHCVESLLEWIRSQSPAEQLLGGSVIDLYD